MFNTVLPLLNPKVVDIPSVRQHMDTLLRAIDALKKKRTKCTEQIDFLQNLSASQITNNSTFHTLYSERNQLPFGQKPFEEWRIYLKPEQELSTKMTATYQQVKQMMSETTRMENQISAMMSGQMGMSHSQGSAMFRDVVDPLRKQVASLKEQIIESLASASITNEERLDYVRAYEVPQYISAANNRIEKLDREIESLITTFNKDRLSIDFPSEVEHARREEEKRARDVAIYAQIEERMANCDYTTCIDGFATVTTSMGAKFIKDVRIGDCLLNAEGCFETVAKIWCEWNPRKRMCDVQGVCLSHNHPVFVDSVWCYPSDVADVYTAPKIVHNFEMEGPSHTIMVDGLACATIGKGPTDLRARNPKHDAKYGRGWWFSEGHLQYNKLCRHGRVISSEEHIEKLYLMLGMCLLPDYAVTESCQVDLLYEHYVPPSHTGIDIVYTSDCLPSAAIPVPPIF